MATQLMTLLSIDLGLGGDRIYTFAPDTGGVGLWNVPSNEGTGPSAFSTAPAGAVRLQTVQDPASHVDTTFAVGKRYLVDPVNPTLATTFEATGASIEPPNGAHLPIPEQPTFL